MAAAGVQVRTPADLAGFGAADEQWLPLAATRGWVVLMRDQRVRYRELEKHALIHARVGAFVFTGGQATAAETAELVCQLRRKFANINRSECKPFLYSFGMAGAIHRIALKN
jgi:PIN domain-containing protein